MSVYTQEYQSEEFPGLAAIFRDTLPSQKPRTTPLCLAVAEDAGLSKTLAYAASAFAAAAIDDMSAPKTSAKALTASPSSPKASSFTMEDGGESDGAMVTSAIAAKLLAEANDAPALILAEEDDEDAPGFLARQVQEQLSSATGLDRYRRLCLTPNGC